MYFSLWARDMRISTVEGAIVMAYIGAELKVDGFSEGSSFASELQSCFALQSYNKFAVK